DWVAGLFDDTWSLSLAGPQTWTPLATSGGPPPARFGATAIDDPVRQRLVLFGGLGASGVLNDVWVLDLAGAPVWAMLAPAGAPPPPRYGHSAVYDPAGDRMIVFGGYAGARLGDLWQLTLSGTPTWSVLTASGTPPSARYRFAAGLDPVGGRMLIHAGLSGLSTGELWELTLGPSPAWHLLSPTGTSPGNRAAHSAVYDAARQRMLFFGGGTEAVGVTSSTYALALNGPPVWSLLAPAGARPNPRCDQSAIYDAANDRMVIYGGQKCSGIEEMVSFDNAFALTFAGAVDVPPSPVQPISLMQAYPNPARGVVTFSFTLQSRARVRLGIYDLAGRRRAELLDRELGAGLHSVSWTRPEREAAGIGPGVYFQELRIGER